MAGGQIKANGKLKSNKYCMQDLDVLEMMELGCSYSDCKHCGHNLNVWRYRKRLIQAYGLTKCEDGLYRFIIPKTRRGWTKNVAEKTSGN